MSATMVLTEKSIGNIVFIFDFYVEKTSKYLFQTVSIFREHGWNFNNSLSYEMWFIEVVQPSLGLKGSKLTYE